MKRTTRTEQLKSKLIGLKWRQIFNGKWAHQRLGNRRFTFRAALLESRLIADPRSPTPLVETHRIQRYRDQMLTPLRKMKVAKTA